MVLGPVRKSSSSAPDVRNFPSPFESFAKMFLQTMCNAEGIHLILAQQDTVDVHDMWIRLSVVRLRDLVQHPIMNARLKELVNSIGKFIEARTVQNANDHSQLELVLKRNPNWDGFCGYLIVTWLTISQLKDITPADHLMEVAQHMVNCISIYLNVFDEAGGWDDFYNYLIVECKKYLSLCRRVYHHFEIRDVSCKCSNE